MELDKGKNTKLKRMAWLMALLVTAGTILGAWGCGVRPGPGSGIHEDKGQDGVDDRLCVVTTIFPYYDFVRQIAGDRVKLKLVVPAGMDSHSFEPTPADMIAMQEADVLVLNGGEMEHWVGQVLDSLDTSHMKILTMMDYVDAVEEEHVEGMEDAHEHGEGVHGHVEDAHEDVKDARGYGEDTHVYEDHEGVPELHAYDDRDGHEMDIEYDEHIWTSPVNAQAIVKIISQTLMEAAPADSSRFKANADAYIEELKELDGRFRLVVAQGRNHMIVVADKFPFRYFADEYGLAYRAAFSGCSTDTEPSAKTIAYLIDKVKEEQIHGVYYLELSSHRTAEIISEETGAVPLLLHSCHNVTRKQFDEGVTYLQLMNQNVENLRKGLE
ncbi:metal ABC transporter substrate-binding protein [Enterocloster aldenensis]|uniref:metal ABC transporter substrate-binding protein n=1 Tax=Enterocloster aldenensis TaxID=358742 RepID=UPI0034A716BA